MSSPAGGQLRTAAGKEMLGWSVTCGLRILVIRPFSIGVVVKSTWFCNKAMSQRSWAVLESAGD